MSGRKKGPFIALFLVVIALGIWYLSDDGKKKRIDSKGENYTVPFKKEGSLLFLGTGGDTIRMIDIEIADSRNQQAQGLMYRGTMTDSQGMLFIFDIEEPRTFWMKNTYISLDILFASKDGRIVSISRNTIPYSEEPIASKAKALYVIEVLAGFCDQYGIEAGQKIEFFKGDKKNPQEVRIE
jgi:uncharacterized protein